MRLLPTSLTLVSFTIAAGLAGCGSDAPSTNPGTAGGSNSAAGATTTVPGAGAAGKPIVATAGTGNGSGGAPAGSAGSGNPTAGSNSVAGSSPNGGSGNNTSTGGSGNNTSTGGKGGSAGSGTAGSGTAGAGNPNGPDAMGKTNAKPGDMASTKFDYLKMGEIRILNNNWGSVASGCATPMSVFVAADKSFGWNFDRGTCDASGQHPDFPQLEFGIHPFGIGSSDATSPNFSSTTLLPLQIKDITSISVTLTDLKIEFQKEGKWDLSFEFWLSSKDPGKTQGDAGVYSELMTFWGWEANRWPENAQPPGPLVRNSTCTGSACPKAGEQVTAGKTYKLEVQDDAWGKWRYFQFRDTAGSNKSFPGKLTVDVKKLIDYLVSKGYSKDLWVARLEVGSEIDDNTKGKVSMTNVEFEVNGQKRSPVFGQ
ncbi:MAG TPA: hypothetical protein VER12_08805 [Polyangiaceae bacterium]|nr:hypothetical protein [Polyangiaceae bacterium]